MNTETTPTNKSKLSMLFKLRININGHPTTALIDSGASCCFLNSRFVENHKLPTQPNRKPQQVRLATGVRAQVVEKARKIEIQMGSYHDHQKFMVLPLEGNDVILGMAWLRRLNPKINWRQNVIHIRHRKRNHTLRVQVTDTQLTNSQISLTPPPKNPVPANTGCEIIAARAMRKLVRRGEIEALILGSMIAENMSNEKKGKLEKCTKEIMSEYQDLFPDDLPSTLPPTRGVDHRIELLPGSQPVYRSMYRMSPGELD